jgi:hypothetical protein
MRPTSRVNSWARLRGCSGVPSACPHTSVCPFCRMPSISSRSACRAFSRRSSLTAREGRVIARTLSVLGALNLKPDLVCSILSTTRKVPRSRSTFFQRNPKTSPRRIPVMSAINAGQYVRVCFIASSSRTDCSADKVINSRRSTLGRAFPKDICRVASKDLLLDCARQRRFQDAMDVTPGPRREPT